MNSDIHHQKMQSHREKSLQPSRLGVIQGKVKQTLKILTRIDRDMEKLEH